MPELAPSIDVLRLRKELEYITDHREEWNQTRWIIKTDCGSYGCLAGNTVLHEGLSLGIAFDTDEGWAYDTILDGQSIGDAAGEILGLTMAQQGALFHPLNDLWTMWTLASRWTNGEIEVPEDVKPV